MSIQLLFSKAKKSFEQYAFKYNELSHNRVFERRSIPDTTFCVFKCKKLVLSKINVISCRKYKSNFLAAIRIFILPCQWRIYFIPIIFLHIPNFEGYWGIVYANVTWKLIWWEMFTFVTQEFIELFSGYSSISTKSQHWWNKRSMNTLNAYSSLSMHNQAYLNMASVKF